jgi:hypothetical protein
MAVQLPDNDSRESNDDSCGEKLGTQTFVLYRGSHLIGGLLGPSTGIGAVKKSNAPLVLTGIERRFSCCPLRSLSVASYS